MRAGSGSLLLQLQLLLPTALLTLLAPAATHARFPPPFPIPAAQINPGELNLHRDPPPSTGVPSLRIMPLGASITAGQLGTVITNGYRKPLRDALVAEGDTVDMVGTQAHGDMTDNQHEGYPGITTEGLVNRIRSNQAIKTLRPNLILLNVGTNDCSLGVDRAVSRRAYSDLIDAVFAPVYATGDKTQFLIVSTLLPRRFGTDAMNLCSRQFNADLRELARTHPMAAHIALADMADGYITEADIGDSVHPTAEGYAKMAVVWMAAIRAARPRINPPVA